jgi:hypothetical protein
VKLYYLSSGPYSPISSFINANYRLSISFNVCDLVFLKNFTNSFIVVGSYSIMILPNFKLTMISESPMLGEYIS